MATSFVDIEKIVRDWGWSKYGNNPTRKQKNLKEKHDRHEGGYIELRIDWSGCEFTDVTIWSKLEDDKDFKSDSLNTGDASSSPPPAESNHVESSTTPSSTAAPHPSRNPGISPTDAAPMMGGSEACALFKTEFTNNTKSEQKYTMNIQKTTKSTCETEVESGVTKGFELGVTLKMPCEVLEVNAGYHQEVSLTKTTGQCFEEELQWGASSEISVAANTIAEAQLLVREKKQSGKFTITTRIRGYVGVTFTNLRDNNSFLKRSDGNIAYVVSEFLKKRQKLGEQYPFISIDTDDVVVKTEGTSHFRFGVKQEVMVNQRPVDPSKK